MSVPPLPELRCVPPDQTTALGLSRVEQTRWFAEEVQLHGGQLKAYLRSAYPTVRDVDDLVQESYLRIWRRHLVRPIASTKRFLFQVARHLAIDAVRHNRAAPIDDVIDFEGLSVVEDRRGIAESTCVSEEINLLFEAIDKLPARCREIVILRKIQGLSQKDIAKKLGLSESTVQVQASRGLRRCAEYLRERGIRCSSAS